MEFSNVASLKQTVSIASTYLPVKVPIKYALFQQPYVLALTDTVVDVRLEYTAPSVCASCHTVAYKVRIKMKTLAQSKAYTSNAQCSGCLISSPLHCRGAGLYQMDFAQFLRQVITQRTLTKCTTLWIFDNAPEFQTHLLFDFHLKQLVLSCL